MNGTVGLCLILGICVLTSFASIHLNNQFSVKVSTSHQENDDEEGMSDQSREQDVGV